MTPFKKIRQIERTKRLLTEAFLQLIEEKPYKKITITDICNRADFSRKTFYAHYETKEDIIAEYLDNLLEVSFYEPFSEAEEFPLSQGEDLQILKLITMWKENSLFFRFLIENGLNDLLLKVYIEKLNKIQVDVINPALSVDPQKIPIDYFYIYMANAQIGILQHWVERDVRISFEDIGRILKTLTGPNTFINFVNEFENNPVGDN